MALPPLNEDELEAILLRLPPDDPAPLFRAAVVNKAWCCLISGAAFHRRFRELHRGAPPPLLGLIYRINKRISPVLINEETEFTPASTFRLPPSTSASTIVSSSLRAMDALHGRILFWDSERLRPGEYMEFYAWSPFASDRAVRRLPMLYLPKAPYRWAATLLCGSATAVGCHRNQQEDCSSGDGAFTVVFVHKNMTMDDVSVSVYVYSSEHDVWSEPVCIHQAVDHRNNLDVISGTTALLGNVVYFPCLHEHRIKLLGYDLCKQQASFVNLPLSAPNSFKIALTKTTTTTTGDRLGFAVVRGTKIFTWSRKATDDDDDWTQERVFELDEMLPSWVFSSHYVITPAMGNDHGVFVVKAQQRMVFTVDLKSGGATKRLEATVQSKSMHDVVLYRSFCIPRFASVANH